MPTVSATATLSPSRILIIERDTSAHRIRGRAPAVAAKPGIRRRSPVTARVEDLGYSLRDCTIVAFHGLSYRDALQPVLTEIFARVSAGEFDIVALASPDRLGRHYATSWSALCAAAAKGGAKLVMTCGPACALPPDENTMLMGALLATHADFERHNRRHWARLARNARPRRGDAA